MSSCQSHHQRWVLSQDVYLFIYFPRQVLLCSLGWSHKLSSPCLSSHPLPEWWECRLHYARVSRIYLGDSSPVVCHYSLQSKDLVSFVPDSRATDHCCTERVNLLPGPFGGAEWALSVFFFFPGKGTLSAIFLIPPRTPDGNNLKNEEGFVIVVCCVREYAGCCSHDPSC